MPKPAFHPLAHLHCLFTRVLASGALCLVLAACTLPGSGVEANGGLKLLYAPFPLNAEKLPEYWLYASPVDDLVTGQPSPNRSDDTLQRDTLFWQDIDGRIALGVSSHPAQNRHIQLGRRTNVAILGSPYLSFDWQLRGGAKGGDTTLILGFRNQNAGSWNENDLGIGLPGVDYVLQIPVGGAPGAKEPLINNPAPDETGYWQTDYLDLATLHRHYWPDANTRDVKLVWIGIATGPHQSRPAQAVTYLSHILLSR
ncbi:hypothetical protein [Thalassospira marina]|uniref:DUF3047 domain-containing protein n=1 Tax=Thalassospira marina TaxID=2048283 RepID=A0ABN5FFM5_9PROT|nr:hypothetical protein [Thalassospira marina]AUG53268.1 hypothetical protein CSC3H3_11510 [Thalassospira marina]